MLTVVGSGTIWAMVHNEENNTNNDLSQTDPKVGKRKAVEAIGCLLYVVAFLIMGSVLLKSLGRL